MFSIRNEYDNESILLTGGLGFLGSVVLEQLLRTTNVKRIYVMARAKRTVSPHDRVATLLRSGLFHQVRAQDSNAGRRVVVLAGDVSSPNLGLSGAELDLLLSDVTVVLHCAASVALDADIQATLRNNCYGTLNVRDLATQMPHLKSFVHVSTYFVNNHRPRNQLIEEKIFPMDLGGMSASDVVAQIMAAPKDEAAALAASSLLMVDGISY